jgi:hypothetical protein
MDPDPALMPNTDVELTRWTSSLGLFMRNFPQSQLVVSLISGIFLPNTFITQRQFYGGGVLINSVYQNFSR